MEMRVKKAPNFSGEPDRWLVSDGSHNYLRYDMTVHSSMTNGGGTYFATPAEAQEAAKRFNRELRDGKKLSELDLSFGDIVELVWNNFTCRPDSDLWVCSEDGLLRQLHTGEPRRGSWDRDPVEGHLWRVVYRAKSETPRGRGTIQDLNLRPGDVVECVTSSLHHVWTVGKKYTMTDKGLPTNKDHEGRKVSISTFRVVSRGNTTPKLWRDMTDEERGALLLAHHEGKVIEVHLGGGKWASKNPGFSDTGAYRVKPEPVRETVTLHGNCDGSTWLNFGKRGSVNFDTHRITLDLIDGKPNCKKCPRCGTAPIDMEEL